MQSVFGEKLNARQRNEIIWGSAGLVISGVLAIAVGFSAYLRLYFLPSNLIWAGIFLLLIAGTLLLCFTKRYLLLTRLSLASLGLAVLTALIFSANGPAIAAFLWLTGLAAALGSLLLDWFRLGREPALAERLLVGTPLGLGVLALLTYLLGAANVYAEFLDLPTRYFKLLHPLPVFLILIALTVLAAAPFYRRVRAGWQCRAAGLRQALADNQAEVTLSLAIFALCLLPLLFWALSPTIRFDSLVYHLAAPARYVDFHGLVEVTEPHHFYMSHYAEMLFSLALVVVGQPLPGLLHLLSGLVTVGLTLLIARRLGWGRTGWIAALLLISLPIFYDAGTVHNDFFVAMFSLASFYALLAWWQDRRFAWLLLAGILAGLSIGTKINAAMPALAGGIAILVAQFYRRTTWKRIGLELAGYALPMLLMYAPWAILNGLWTHNPFFPFFCQYFACSSSGLSDLPVSQSSFLQQLVDNFVLLPWNVTVFGENYYIENFGGAGGAVFLFSLPWFVALRRNGQATLRTAGLLALFTALNFLLLFPFSQRTRYVLPVIPLLCILAAVNLEMVWDFLRRSPWRKGGIALGVVLLALYFLTTRLVVTSSGWQLAERYPYRVALGLESPAEYLSRALPSYDALRYIEQHSAASTKVASFGDESRIYTRADVHTVYYSNELIDILAAAGSPAEIAAGLKQHGYQYILHNPVGMTDSNYQIDARMVSDSYLAEFTRLVFVRHNVFVYELLPASDPLPPGVNLLSNSGFEQVENAGGAAAWTAYNAPQLDTTGTVAHSGEVAALASDQDYVYQRVLVEGDQLYTLGFWSRSQAGEEPIRMQVLWLDGRSAPITTTIENVTTVTEWAWQQMSYSAPADAVYAQIYLTTGSSQAAWFDDVCFTAGPACTSGGAGQ